MDPTSNLRIGSLFDTTHVSPASLLPPEVIFLILSNIDDFGIQVCSNVNKQWNTVSVNVGKFRELKSIVLHLELSIFFLENKDSEFSEVDTEILRALYGFGEIEISGFSLQQIKLSSDETKNKIINILKHLNTFDLIELIKISEITKNLFKTAQIYKEIDILKNTETNLMIRNQRISQKVPQLAEVDQLDKAVELTLTSSSVAMGLLFSQLNKAPIYKSINLVIKLLNYLIIGKNDQQLYRMLFALSSRHPLVQNNFFAKIGKLAHGTDDFAVSYPTFGNILGILLNYNKYKGEQKNADEIIRLAQLLALKLPYKTLIDISKNLLKDGKKKEATLVAMQILDNDLKKTTLAKIKSHNKDSCIMM